MSDEIRQEAVEIDDATRDFLARRGAGELAHNMRIEFQKLSAELSIARMPAEGNRQPIGVIHGGAYCVLAESLGSVSANIHAGEGRFAVGVDINATHTRSVSEGWVVAECRAIHLGRSTTVHEVIISDEEGRRVSTARITNFLRDRT